MKKLSLLLCLALVLSLLLTACGQADINTPGSSVPDANSTPDSYSRANRSVDRSSTRKEYS